MILAIGVLIASFAAFVSMRQASIMNEQTAILLQQTKANVWPYLYLNLDRGYDQGGISNYRITITNKGTGPAIIERVKVSYAGEAVENWNSLYEKAAVPDSVFRGHSNMLYIGL